MYLGGGRGSDTQDITPPLHHCLYVYPYPAVLMMNFARTIKSRFFPRASFTFMIKARTKMDKACNGVKIKAARRRHDGDRSHLCITKEKVWALNMVDYVCSARWRGIRPASFCAERLRRVPSPIHFSSASAPADLERPIYLPDCARVDIIVSHYSRATSLDTT